MVRVAPACCLSTFAPRIQKPGLNQPTALQPLDEQCCCPAPTCYDPQPSLIALQAMHEQYARLLHQRRLEQESAAAAAAAASRNPVTSCSRAAAAAVLAAAGQGAGRRRAKPAWQCDTSTSLREATLEATLRSQIAVTNGQVARKVSPQWGRVVMMSN